MKWEAAFELAMKLKVALAEGCERLEIVGSVKRHDKDDCGDIEILCIPDPGRPIPRFGDKVIFRNALEKTVVKMQEVGLIGKPKLNGDKLKKFPILNTGEINPFYLELYIVKRDTWAIQNVIRTGPSEFSHRFVTNKSQGGLLPNDYKYIAGETKIQCKTQAGYVTLTLQEEEDAIALLGRGWIEPKDRKLYINR